jgi:hypothetical protein
VERTASQDLLFGKLDWRPNNRHSFTANFNFLDWDSPNGVQTAAVTTNAGAFGYNGNATVNGWEHLTMLPDMTREQLEQMLGINLHDPSAPDFGRFDAKSNGWYREHKAGASFAPGSLRIPTPNRASMACSASGN